MRRRTATLLLVGALLSGCVAGGPADSGVPTSLPTPSADAGVLPVGSNEIPVSGEVFSPLDFVPPLRLTVPDGWVSRHRADDAFDLARTGVVVAFVTPPEATAAEALATLRTRTSSSGEVRATIGGKQATGFDVIGGTGLLVESPAGTLSVDRAPDQRSRVLGLDLDDTPLLVIITAADLAAVQPAVDALLNGVVQG